MLSLSSRHVHIAILCILLVAAVAALDLLSPLGVAAAAFYSIAIAATMLAEDPRLTRSIASLCLGLILLGGLTSPESVVPDWMVIVNRTLFMIMAMITALLVSNRLRDMQQIREQQQLLEQANRQLERLAHVDGLTGVSNRRAFDALLTQECARIQRTGQPLSLLMIDVDLFKRYNDAAGHQAGDEVLQNVARTISSSLRRPIDFVARYGGEEFAVILPATAEAGARERAEEIRRAVEELKIRHPGLPGDANVTVSVGACTLSTAVAPDELLRCADVALYQAKSAGRNCVAAHVPSDGQPGTAAIP